MDTATNRLQDIPSNQLVLLTQGLLPLGASNDNMVKILDHWAAQFNDTARLESLLSDSIGTEMVADKRKDLEKKGQLNKKQQHHRPSNVRFTHRVMLKYVR